MNISKSLSGNPCNFTMHLTAQTSTPDWSEDTFASAREFVFECLKALTVESQGLQLPPEKLFLG